MYTGSRDMIREVTGQSHFINGTYFIYHFFKEFKDAFLIMVYYEGNGRFMNADDGKIYVHVKRVYVYDASLGKNKKAESITITTETKNSIGYIPPPIDQCDSKTDYYPSPSMTRVPSVTPVPSMTKPVTPTVTPPVTPPKEECRSNEFNDDDLICVNGNCIPAKEYYHHLNLLPLTLAAMPQSIITLPILLNYASDMQGLDLELRWDPAAAGYRSLSDFHELLPPNQWHIDESGTSSGLLKVKYLGLLPVDVNGQIASLQLKVLGQPGEIVPVELSSAKIYNSEGQLLSGTSHHGSIQITNEVVLDTPLSTRQTVDAAIPTHLEEVPKNKRKVNTSYFLNIRTYKGKTYKYKSKK